MKLAFFGHDVFSNWRLCISVILLLRKIVSLSRVFGEARSF
jgi:hypothetical protein